MLGLVFMTIDLVLNFFCAYSEKGEMIKDKKRIARWYLTHYFFFDFYSIVFLIIDAFELDQYFPSKHMLYFFHCFYYLKIFSVKLYFTRLEELFNMYSYFKNWIQIIKLFAIMVIMSHIFGIMWF
jgi:hypothetical protein